MPEPIKVLAFAGSLRSGSFNKKLVQAAAQIARKAGAEVTVVDLRDFNMSLYDGDDEADSGIPEGALRFKQVISSHDALLISAPEYNSSISGVLKNAIDWASRPPDQPFAGKPVAIMGAGAGMAGTARAQYDLRRCCVFLDMHPINKPEVLIGVAHTKFDAEGAFTDEAGRGFIRDLLVALERWTRLIARKN